MTRLLTMIDRVNGYATNFRTTEYANRLAATKSAVDDATGKLIRPFVFGGAGGKTAFGFDFRNNGDIYWSTVANSAFGSNNINGIACGNGRWVAAGMGGKIAYSDNGVSWTSLGAPAEANALYAAPYGNGKWVAGSSSPGGNNPKIACSTDGINWNWTGLGTPLGTDALYAAVPPTAGF